MHSGGIRVRRQQVSSPVRRANTYDSVRRRQGVQCLADRINCGPLRHPRCPDNLQAVGDRDGIRILNDMNMIRFPLDKDARTVDGGRVQRIMVSRQEIYRNRYLLEGFHRARNRLPVDLVRLKCIAAHQHKPAVLFRGDSPQRSNGVEPRLAVSLLGAFRKKVSRHPQLPVACMQETKGHSLFSLSTRWLRLKPGRTPALDFCPV